MKKIILFSVLSASIAFNITFVIGFIMRPKPPIRFQRDLKKDRAVRRFFIKNRINVKTAHSDIDKAKKDFFEYLAKKDFDEVIAHQKIEKIIQNQKNLETIIGSGLIKFRNQNGAEKCKEIFQHHVKSQRFHNKKRGERR